MDRLCKPPPDEFQRCREIDMEELDIMNQKYHEFYRGEVYYADMSNIFAGGMAGRHPVLVLLTDQGLYNSPNVLVAETRQNASQANLMIGQTYPIDKRRLRKKAGKLTPRQMEEVDAALQSVFTWRMTAASLWRWEHRDDYRHRIAGRPGI